MPEPALLGVGVDLEDRGAFDRMDGAALRRAAARWLTPAERAWCAEQSSPGESLVVVLCCKEAAFKAWNGSGAAHAVRLAIGGSPEAGCARAEQDAVTVDVRWRRWAGQVLAVAVARAQEPAPA